MEIVKVGWRHPEWKDEVQCQECGTVLEVTRNDLKTYQFKDGYGFHHNVICRCESCKGWVTVHIEAEKWGDLPAISYVQFLEKA